MADMEGMKRFARRRMPTLYESLRRRRSDAREARAATLAGPPARFAGWLDRLPDQRRQALPEQWLSDQRGSGMPRVAVVVHCFFPELLAEIIEGLANIGVPFDLIVTNASGATIRVDCPAAATIRVLEVENHGRDIWPLLQVVNAGLLDPYEVVLKVHTKRSEWRGGHELGGDGGQWRNQLLTDLIGSRQQADRILSAFVTDPGLGLVTSDESILGPQFWGDNESTTAELARRLELPLQPARLRFAAGSMYWVRGFVLQGLRALNCAREDFEEEAGQVNATTAHAIERLIGIVTLEAGYRIGGVSGCRAEHRGQALSGPPTTAVRVVPFYLPQFHPVPENDRWWGRGFTEWTNVTGARPVFSGHHQPRLPTVTGFYDLRLPESVAMQNELARSANVSGFMYYHYWFAGRPILERPLQDRLAGDDPLPFCIMWANENWTRRWDGRSENILLGQDYEHVDSALFLDDAMPYLLDERYLRIDGRPVVAIYRPRQIPALEQTVASFRDKARQAGLPGLFLLSVDVDQEFDGLAGDVQRVGFDGVLGFPPHRTTWPPQRPRPDDVDPRFHGNILSYQQTVAEQVAGLPVRFGHPDSFPGVMVTFDNTARRQWSSDIWYGSNPYTFHRWLAASIAQVMPREPEHRLVFINAWNEWAEGAVLEPQDRVGSAYLLAVRSAIDAASRAVPQ